MATNSTGVCNISRHFGFNVMYVVVPLTALIAGKTVIVILTTCRTAAFHTNMYVIMSSLSVVDAVMAATYIGVGASDGIIGQTNAYTASAINKFLLGAWCASILACVVHLSCLSVERHLYIAHPFFYIKNITRKVAFIVIMCIWVMFGIFLFIPLLAYGNNYIGVCLLFRPPVEYFFLAAAVYLASLATAFTSHMLTARVAFRYKKEANKRRLKAAGIQITNIPRTNFILAMRSLKLFTTIFNVFLLFTLPPIIIAGLSAFHSLPEYLHFTIMFMIPVYSIVSFLLYIHVIKEFSIAIKKAFSCSHN